MIEHILGQLQEVAADVQIFVVVGHEKQLVQEVLRRWDVHFIEQPFAGGTGHALQCALEDPRVSACEQLIVLPGDTPFLEKRLLIQMMQHSLTSEVLLVTTEVHQPQGYGRVVKTGNRLKKIVKIVEQKDATLYQQKITCVNTGLLRFHVKFLHKHLGRLKAHNEQKELYLTDLIQIAAKQGKVVELFWKALGLDSVMGVNDMWQAMQAERQLCMRLCEQWALQGVRFENAQTVYIEPDVVLGAEVWVGSGVRLVGKTVIEAKSVIEGGSVLVNARLEQRVHVKQNTRIEDSMIQEKAVIGPFAHIRPGCWIGPGVKVGNFVELKKTHLGQDTKVSHLSYLGDAEVGKRVNIGCGFITCNYDGEKKHQTIIEDEAFIGSDCQVIAPVSIGKRAVTAAGSTLVADVPAGALGIARARQVNKLGYKKKPKT
jgi:bifunctional UDP-N-acetylglucosamine pyrophosphorylase/glucosamine-1-phosphate N-acetyltransferase